MLATRQLKYLIPILLGSCLLISAGSALAGDCKADLKSQLFKEEKDTKVITYTFKVDVKSPERCADVDYVLTVVESAAGKEDETKEISHRTRVRDGVTTSAKVRHKMDREHRLVSWNFEVEGCEPCGAAKKD